jgi:hypothetical protein
MAVKYIPVIKNGFFIAGLEQAWQGQEYWCANYTKNPYSDKEIKYFNFGGSAPIHETMSDILKD